jgi:hypothetical protein
VVQRLRLHAAEHRRAAAFPAVAVLHLADDVLVAALAVRQDGAQVALRAGRHEQRRLEAEQRGDAVLQRVDVGSSPNTSSPSGAASIASRMAAVGRVTVSLRRSTTGGRSRCLLQEVLQHRVPVLGEDGLGMELHALDGQLRVAHAHDLAVGRPRRAFSSGGQVSRSIASEW